MAKTTKKKPGEPKRKKSTAAVVLLRVEEILRIRIDGAQFHDVREYAAENSWGVSESQLWNYIKKADNLLVDRQDSSRKRTLALHFAKRDALYARSVNAADYRTALSIIADVARLRGLYPAEKKSLDLKGGVSLGIVEQIVIAADDHEDGKTVPATG